MKIILAPMEGVVDSYMRNSLTAMGGYTHCVTEFIRVVDHLLPPKVFYRHCPELKIGGRTPAGTPVIVQLLGADPDAMAENAKRAVDLGAPGIDLNFGCPSRCVNKKKGGAILLKEPEKLYNIVVAVRNAVKKEIPVSAKIRLGFEDTALVLDNASAVENAGADFLTVHARTKVDGYKPPAKWEWIATIKQHINIPIVANGDIDSVEQYTKCLSVSKCNDIMIGRGAVANPYLANQIQQLQKKEVIKSLGWQEISHLILEQATMMESEYASKKINARIKQWIGMMKRTNPDAARCFEKIRTVKELNEMRQLIENHME